MPYQSDLPKPTTEEEPEDAAGAAALRAQQQQNLTGTEEEESEGPIYGAGGGAGRDAPVDSPYRLPVAASLLALPVNPNAHYRYTPKGSRKVYVIRRIA